MEAEIVVHAAQGDVARALHAVFEEQREIRRGNHVNVADGAGHAARFGKDFRAHSGEDFFHAAGGWQGFAQHAVHNGGKWQRADVGNVRALAGNDEFPAGGDHIVLRVLGRIAQPN